MDLFDRLARKHAGDDSAVLNPSVEPLWGLTPAAQDTLGQAFETDPDWRPARWDGADETASSPPPLVPASGPVPATPLNPNVSDLQAIPASNDFSQSWAPISPMPAPDDAPPRLHNPKPTEDKETAIFPVDPAMAPRPVAASRDQSPTEKVQPITPESQVWDPMIHPPDRPAKPEPPKAQSTAEPVARPALRPPGTDMVRPTPQIRIGQITIKAPEPGPVAPPPAPVMPTPPKPAAPTGAALKSYLGWRR